MVVLLLLSLFLFGSCSCEIPCDDSSFRVLSYNVQTLFDDRLDGCEYEEYQDTDAWNSRSYRMRLRTLSTVLLDASLGYPDVLVLQEVENSQVVKDLLSYHLGAKGYHWYAAAKEDGGAISVAVISRHPIGRTLVHATENCRPILQADIATSRETVSIFALHAKSQIGEYQQTEALRLELVKSLKQAAQKCRDNLVLLCGDFNEDPVAVWEGNGVQTALVDAGYPDAQAYAAKGSLLISGDQNLVGPSIWYDSYLDQSYEQKREGSCNWDGTWHSYDQILCNSKVFDHMGWEYADFCVCDQGRCLTTDGKPHGWNLPTQEGVSDHLPVLLTLKRR